MSRAVFGNSSCGSRAVRVSERFGGSSVGLSGEKMRHTTGTSSGSRFRPRTVDFEIYRMRIPEARVGLGTGVKAFIL